MWPEKGGRAEFLNLSFPKDKNGHWNAVGMPLTTICSTSPSSSLKMSWGPLQFLYSETWVFRKNGMVIKVNHNCFLHVLGSVAGLVTQGTESKHPWRLQALPWGSLSRIDTPIIIWLDWYWWQLLTQWRSFKTSRPNSDPSQMERWVSFVVKRSNHMTADVDCICRKNSQGADFSNTNC